MARGEMNPAMVGFRMTRECAGCTLMPFVAVTVVSYNVQRFPKAREPTVRAAKGFPPPLPSIHLHRPRWQGAKRRRGKRVLGDAGPTVAERAASEGAMKPSSMTLPERPSFVALLARHEVAARASFRVSPTRGTLPRFVPSRTRFPTSATRWLAGQPKAIRHGLEPRLA